MPAIRLMRSVLVVHQQVLPRYRGRHKYPRRSVRLHRLAAISQGVDNAHTNTCYTIPRNHVTLLTRPAYGQERCFALKAWFVLVIYVCMHSSSKACRLLTTSASHPRSVPMVSSPCARFVRRWTSEHHQWSLLDGIGECI